MKYETAKKILSRPETKALLCEGTIVTPFPLIEEIVDKLPIQWDNPNMKFLDPACGRGSFLFVIKHRLMQYHSEQHIVENMLYGVDISDKNVAVAKAVLNSENKYNDNIECGNSLTKEWKMKFDVVIGNPPYTADKTTSDSTKTKQIFVDFLELSKKLSQCVAMIVPATWADKENNRVNKMFSNSHLMHCTECTKSFDVIMPILYFIHDDNYEGLCNVKTSSGDSFMVDLTISRKIPIHGSGVSIGILSKLNKEDNLSGLWNRTNVNRNDPRMGIGTTPIIETVGVASDVPNMNVCDINSTELPNFDNWKVIVGTVTEFGKLGGNSKIAPPGSGATHSVVTFGTASEYEAHNLLSYFNSRVVRFVIKTIKSYTPNNKHMFENVPLVDLTHSWTDAELYAHFNLTEEEIALIESTIK